MTTVLVTGATGFLGTRLVDRLLADGARVRALVRSAAKSKPLTDRGVETVVGDITERHAVEAALDGAGTVYHLAGRLFVPGVPAAEYRRTHVRGTQVVLECCRGASHVERFVHCSTTGVIGVTGDRPADERARLKPTNVYEATKAEAEHHVRRAWRDGFPAVVVRPGLVYGPGDLHLLPFYRAVLSHRFRPIGRRSAWLHPIYIDDMIEAFVRCGRHPAAVRECFNVAGTEPVPLAGLAAAIARAGGTRLPHGHVPVPAARAAAAAGDLLPAKLRASVPLTRSRLEFLTHSRVYDVTKARRILDLHAATDLSTGIARTLAWYRREGYLPARRAR